MCGEYNGWHNWETWNMKLWLDNEQSIYNQALLIARTYPDTYEASRRLKEFVEDLWFPELPAGPLADAANMYLAEVSWYEIIESYQKETEI